MKHAARNIAGARADSTVGRSSIRRQGGDGDVNLADVWPTITRVGARRAEPEPVEEWRVRACTAWMSAGSPAGMLDRPIVRVLGVHYDGGLSRCQA